MLLPWEKARIQNGLEDGCWGARRRAIQTVIAKNLVYFLPQLVEMLANDRDYDVRATAAQAIGVLGNKTHIEVLEKQLWTERDPEAREEIHNAITFLQQKHAVKA